MKEIITVQVIRPNLELLNDSDKKKFIEDMAKDIAHQILLQEHQRVLSEQLEYWNTMFNVWEFDYRIKKIKESEKLNRTE